MPKRVVKLLNEYGPMLSGELSRKMEQEFGISNIAARKALSRAKNPVNKIAVLSFDKNQKFFYLESQFNSQLYIDRLMGAIESSSLIIWSYICAFRAQNGYVAKDLLPALVSSPVQNIKGHKTHQQIVDGLLKCQIIEEYNETHWMLSDWIMVQNRSFARSIGIETVKKQVVNDFVHWARNINLIGYDSAKTFTNSAEFAHFHWAVTAPSYIQPLYDIEQQKPGFVIVDIFYGHVAKIEDVRFFLDKLSVIRAFKNLPTIMPVLLVESVTIETLKELKNSKVTVALIKNIFDPKYTELLAEIVNIFSYSSAIIAKNPKKIEVLFGEIAKAEGRYNDIIGDMFELLIGYYYHHIGCRYLELKRMIRVPDSDERREIDVLVERDGEIIIVECKATRSAIDKAFVDKWLSQNIPKIRMWLLERYSYGKKFRFQLWSLGGFTEEAHKTLHLAASAAKKYNIEFFEKKEIIDMAKNQNVQTVVDILQQHFHPPLEAVLKHD